MQLEEISKELTQYNATDAAIAQRRQKYMELKIKDLDDREGAEAVHVARIDIKTIRVAVEKKAKSLKEDALRFQRDVNSEKTRILNLLAPIEDYLTDEEGRILEEKARIKAEEEAARGAVVKGRMDKLYALDCRYDGTDWRYFNATVATQDGIASMDEVQFGAFCDTIQAHKDAEAKFIVEKEAAQKAETDRLAKIAEEQSRIAAEQEAERVRLAAEAKAIQDEKDALSRAAKAAEDAKLKAEQDKQRAIELEAAKKEAADKARLDELARAAWEIKEKQLKDERAKVAAERKAARRPDKEKLVAYGRAISDVPLPALKHDEFINILTTTTDAIGQVIADLNKRLEEL